ncbi:creatininase family protein [Actinomadura sp. 6N118]|uniref:creatininase family protein n=1 Tax=Actinomadura sp. 6N118 TaxID=3375151 RepID=UPI0037955E5E
MDGVISSLLPQSSTADERDRQARVAVLPIGSFEQHGPYLPLATDTVVACTIAREIAAAYPVLRLPPVTISCSHEHAAWPGTVSISASTLHAVIRDIARSLRRSGVTRLVLVNGHGGNYVLGNIVQEARGEMALFPGIQDWEEARAAAGVQTSLDSDMHAGEIETSILLHAHPELVRPGYESGDHLADDRKHLLTLGMAAYTESGVVGRPSLASADKGRDLLASLVAAFGEYLELLDRDAVLDRDVVPNPDAVPDRDSVPDRDAALGRDAAAPEQ